MRQVLFALAMLVVGCERAPSGDGAAPDPEAWAFPVSVPEILDRSPKPSYILYLNREGARLTGGTDEASLNRSMIVSNANLESFEVPPFRGSVARWDAIVECIRGHFEPYDLEIVEQRPLVPGYMMAMMGGRPGAIGESLEHTHGRVLGLAPFNGQPIENAVIMVFTREIREATRQTCETAAMEIAHAYGLDHTYHCRDLMTYRRRCGARRFWDEDVACGEHEERPCVGPRPTQSSHGRLMEVLGPRGARAALNATD